MRACAAAQLQLHPLLASGVGPRPEGAGWCVSLPVLWACMCHEPAVAPACDAGTTGSSACCRACKRSWQRVRVAAATCRAQRPPQLHHMKDGGVIVAGAAADRRLVATGPQDLRTCRASSAHCCESCAAWGLRPGALQA